MLPWRLHAAPKPLPIIAGNASPGLPAHATPVIVPNGSKLPFTMDGGVKVFHLVAQKVKREFAPDRKSVV